jgi:hypothetical protein
MSARQLPICAAQKRILVGGAPGDSIGIKTIEGRTPVKKSTMWMLLVVCGTGCFGSSGAYYGLQPAPLAVEPGTTQPAPASSTYTSEKSPFAAFVLGVLPGFGVGHFYAGDPRTGRALLGMELVGAGMVTIAIGEAVFEALMEIITLGAYESDPTNNDEMEGLATAGLVIMGCCMVYDAFHAPAVAVRRNHEARRLQATVTPLGAAAMLRF